MMDYWTWALNGVSFVAGSAAVYFFLKIYPRVKKGSIAWLLLATASIFLVAAPLIPYAMRSGVDSELLVLLSTYWGAVYAAFFAGAGLVLYRTFVRVPISSLGEFLIGEVRFAVPAKRGEAKNPQLIAMLENSALIEHSPAVRYEDAVSEIVSSCLSHGRNVLLVTSQPRSEAYAKEFSGTLKEAAVKIASVSMAANMPAKAGGGVLEIPAEEVYSLLDAIAALPEDCAVVFENASQLVQRLGAESAFNLLLSTVERKKSVICLLDAERHGMRELELLGDLFVSRLKVGEDSISPLKGKGLATPFKNYIDYVAFNLR